MGTRVSCVLLAVIASAAFIGGERRLLQVTPETNFNPVYLTIDQQPYTVVATPVTPSAPYSQAAYQCNVSGTGDARIPLGGGTFPLVITVPKGRLVRIIFANGNLNGDVVTAEGEAGIIVKQPTHDETGTVRAPVRGLLEEEDTGLRAVATDFYAQQVGGASPFVQKIGTPVLRSNAPVTALVNQASPTVPVPNLPRPATTVPPAPPFNVPKDFIVPQRIDSPAAQSQPPGTVGGSSGSTLGPQAQLNRAAGPLLPTNLGSNTAPGAAPPRTTGSAPAAAVRATPPTGVIYRASSNGPPVAVGVAPSLSRNQNQATSPVAAVPPRVSARGTPPAGSDVRASDESAAAQPVAVGVAPSLSRNQNQATSPAAAVPPRVSARGTPPAGSEVRASDESAAAPPVAVGVAPSLSRNQNQATSPVAAAVPPRVSARGTPPAGSGVRVSEESAAAPTVRAAGPSLPRTAPLAAAGAVRADPPAAPPQGVIYRASNNGPPVAVGVAPSLARNQVSSPPPVAAAPQRLATDGASPPASTNSSIAPPARAAAPTAGGVRPSATAATPAGSGNNSSGGPTATPAARTDLRTPATGSDSSPSPASPAREAVAPAPKRSTPPPPKPPSPPPPKPPSPPPPKPPSPPPPKPPSPPPPKPSSPPPKPPSPPSPTPASPPPRDTSPPPSSPNRPPASSNPPPNNPPAGGSTSPSPPFGKRHLLQESVPGGPNNGLVEYVSLAANNEVPGFVVPNTQFGVPYIEFTASDANVGLVAAFQGVLQVAQVVDGVVQYPFTPNKRLSPECQINVNFVTGTV